jgi:hypothetical protein
MRIVKNTDQEKCYQHNNRNEKQQESRHFYKMFIQTNFKYDSNVRYIDKHMHSVKYKPYNKFMINVAPACFGTQTPSSGILRISLSQIQRCTSGINLTVIFKILKFYVEI